MVRRFLHLLAGVAALVVAGGATAAAGPSWAEREIGVVVERGLMAPTPAQFRPDDVLTESELAALAGGLTAQAPARPARPTAPVSMARLNARLVSALALQDASTHVLETARRAGLTPPTRFGTEVVARLLGLRKNHPAAQDALERLPADHATRAEAAYSAARILGSARTEVERARAAAARFSLPQFDPWQRRILTTAFSFVGYPYVWGGESDAPTGPNAPLGPQAQGGFDCSGFVWRVFKLQSYGDGGRLAATLRGRTTFVLSGEIPAAARIPFDRLAPGDLVFFGAKGPRSKPAEVDHMGIYAGGGWIVHSSRDGVTLAAFEGWYRERFAWGRRPLAEAGHVAGAPSPTR